jgi:hypothetical protein
MSKSLLTHRSSRADRARLAGASVRPGKGIRRKACAAAAAAAVTMLGLTGTGAAVLGAAVTGATAAAAAPVTAAAGGGTAPTLYVTSLRYSPLMGG